MRVVKQTLSNRRDTNNIYKSAEKADPNAVCLYHLMLQLKLTAAAKSEGNIVLVDIEEIVDGV